MANGFRSKLVMLLVGIVIGALAVLGFGLLWGVPSLLGVRPCIVEGYSHGTNYDGSAIGVSEELGGPGEGYVIAGAMWSEFGGSWHQGGTPPSLFQPNTCQKVRLGVVCVKPIQDKPGGPAVAWIEVLDVFNE